MAHAIVVEGAVRSDGPDRAVVVDENAIEDLAAEVKAAENDREASMLALREVVIAAAAKATGSRQ